MPRVSRVSSLFFFFFYEGMLQCDKQTFVSFPKHAEIVELILAGKTEPETELGTRSDAGR